MYKNVLFLSDITVWTGIHLICHEILQSNQYQMSVTPPLFKWRGQVSVNVSKLLWLLWELWIRFGKSLAKDPQYTWWRHQMETFSALLAICAGNSPVTGEFPAQRPVTRSFDISLICTRINGWVNNGEAGALRRYRAHYDVTVMRCGAVILSLAQTMAVAEEYSFQPWKWNITKMRQGIYP